MREAGLELSNAGGLAAELRFADLETATRACMSAGVSAQVARAAGEERVRTLVHATLPAFVRPDGSVTLANRFNWIRMRAR